MGPPSSSCASLYPRPTQLPITVHARFRRQKQVLGHLTSCYCMAFDRLSQILFTVLRPAARPPLPLPLPAYVTKELTFTNTRISSSSTCTSTVHHTVLVYTYSLYSNTCTNYRTLALVVNRS